MAPRGEWLGVAFWAGLGTTLFVASWRMDRLAHQGIAPWSAPGLLPGVVGALMVVFALVLAVQAWHGETDSDGEAAQRSADPADPAQAADPLGGWRGSLLATVLCLAFAGFSLGHGLPFVVEAACFILVFTALFRWAAWRAQGRAEGRGAIVRGLAQAAAVAVLAAAAIAWLFESVFLVRLP